MDNKFDINNELKFNGVKFKESKKKNKDNDIYGIFYDDFVDYKIEDDDNNDNYLSKFIKSDILNKEQPDIKIHHRKIDEEINIKDEIIHNFKKENQEFSKVEEKHLSKTLSKKYGKGFEMLKKIGYKVGKGLGLNEQGITDPIEIKKRKKNLGLITDTKIEIDEYEDDNILINEKNSYLLGKKRKEEEKDDFTEFSDFISRWNNIRSNLIEPISINIDSDINEFDWESEINNIKKYEIENFGLNTSNDKNIILKKEISRNQIYTQEDLEKVKDQIIQVMKSIKFKISHHINTLTYNEDKMIPLYYEIFTLKKENKDLDSRYNITSSFLVELNKLKNNLSKINNINEIIDLFHNLHNCYTKEYNTYRKLTYFCMNIVILKMKENYKLESYYRKSQEILPILKSIHLLVEKTTHDHNFNEDENDHLHMFSHYHKEEESEEIKKHEKIFGYFLSEICIKELINYVINEWNVKEYEPIIKIFEIYKNIIPSFIKNFICDNAILPKLKEQISIWNPTIDKTLIHLWIHPWLPTIGLEKLNSIILLIQQKIEDPILNWTTDDYSLISLLTPWKKLFSNDYWTSFFNKYILPKLQANTAKIVIDPLNQKLTGLKNLFVWDDFIHLEIIDILISHFFPRWINALEIWIKKKPCVEEVLKWYEGWKKIFAAKDYIKEEKIKGQFVKALNVITNNFK